MAKDVHPLLVQMRGIRRSAGLSIGDLGKLIHVGPVTVGTWERGDRQPTLHTAVAAFDALGYDLRAVPKGTPGGEPIGAVIALANRLAAIAKSLRALGGEPQ